MGSWDLAPGLNNVGSFQVSGQPYASGNIDTAHGERHGGYGIQFPQVTRWVKIINNDTVNACKVGFSELGVMSGSNYFTVGKGASALPTVTGELEIKVSSLWISGSDSVDIIAGLTGIPSIRTRTDSGPNWSGSSGVG